MHISTYLPLGSTTVVEPLSALHTASSQETPLRKCFNPAGETLRGKALGRKPSTAGLCLEKPEHGGHSLLLGQPSGGGVKPP